MDIDNLSDLPEWYDVGDDEVDEDREQWKPNPTREHCMALYSKWKDIVFMLNGIVKPFMEKGEAADVSITDEMIASIATTIFSDAHIVAVKIRSSEAMGTYVGRMDNASIIRSHAQGIASSLLLMSIEADVDEAHIQTLREEITAFKELFKQWVASFVKDEFTDDWGLFV